MNRKQLFSMTMAAGLLVAGSALSASAGLVQIKLLGAGGSEQTLTLFVAENCARTEWPSFVVECNDVDPDYVQPEDAPVYYAMAPGGRLFKIALGDANAAYASGGAGEWIDDRGRPRDDIELTGATIGGGSQILVHRDANGRVDRSLVRFTRMASWNKFRNGDTSGDLAASWGAIKAVHD